MKMTFKFCHAAVYFTFLFCIPLVAQDLFVEPPTETSPNEQKPETEVRSLPKTLTDSELLQHVIENQLATIRTFDISKAYYAYTTKDFQKNVSLAAFKQFVKKYPVLFRNKVVAHDKITFNGNSANYLGKFISTDGETSEVEIVLILTEDEWKINSINLKSSASSTRNISR